MRQGPRLSVGFVGQAFFSYALHRLDPVFMLGEAAGIFIYSRNLQLIWRNNALDRGWHSG